MSGSVDERYFNSVKIGSNALVAFLQVFDRLIIWQCLQGILRVVTHINRDND